MKHFDSQELRDRHPHFYYRKSTYTLRNNGLELSFVFELENGPIFQPKIFFPNVSQERMQTLDQHLLQEWCFQIGLVEMLSYWKTACSPTIVIEAGYIDSEQITFWYQLLEKGLSEFFFINQIDGWQKDFVKIQIEHDVIDRNWKVVSISEKALIPVGGGKDSAVSLELAKQLQIPVQVLTLNINDQVKNVISVSGYDPTYNIQRSLDSQLTELNQHGYLNGHTPFSALLAFISSLAGLVYDFKYIVLSNEWSANEGNTVFLGQTINHQYSKTFEFEIAFSNYLKKYITSEILYFSWLRPLHEIQIALLFSQSPQYFPVFLSCNRGQKTGKWCGICPKCVFVFILLSAFLPQEVVQGIWGKDLFENEQLLEILQELTGQVEVKSLECVGTRQESIYSLALALQMNKGRSQSLLWREAEKIVGNIDQKAIEAREFIRNYEDDSRIPSPFKSILLDRISEMK